MQISSTTSAGATTSTTSSSSAGSLAANYQSFLTLLLKQLEVQDPTNPVDANEYTSQLVQLASLEQDVANGAKLDALTTAMTQLGSGIAAIGYIGRTVEAEGDTTALQDGEASWEYDLDSDAKTVALTVRGEDGSVVYRQTGDSSAGTHSFTWDGVGTDGTVHTDGSFTLSVDAVDTANATVSTTTRIKAVVNAVDTSSSATVLDLGSGVTITADAVLSVS